MLSCPATGRVRSGAAALALALLPLGTVVACGEDAVEPGVVDEDPAGPEGEGDEGGY